MFDLNQHVRSWRDAAAGTLGSELLDELEAHLRDEFDRLITSGQSPEQAWDAALQKLGRPQKLAGEFAKLQRRFWLPAWVATGALALIVAIILCFVIASMAKFRPLLASHVVFITAGYTAVFAIGFLGICAVFIRAVASWSDREDAALRSAGARLALFALITTLIGIVLGAWWAHGNLGRWWGWDPREIGGLCVLMWAGLLVQSFRSHQSPAQSRICFALLGNMVVALSWFGPMLLGGHYEYGYPSWLMRMFLSGFLIAQILLVSLLLLPPGVLRLRRFRPL